MKHAIFNSLKSTIKLYIASKVLGVEKDSLIFGFESSDKMERIAMQYISGKPLSKIFKERHFWKYTFYTDKHTLDPRPSTERIIEEMVLRHKPEESFRFLDLGSGTGAICGTILSIFPNATCTAIDKSIHAINTTKFNLKKLGVIDRCQVLQNNWLDGIEENFDILLSNPPYLSQDEYVKNKNVLKYDPKIALVSPDPLLMYKKISEKQTQFSEIYLEVPPIRKKQIKALFKDAYLCY